MQKDLRESKNYNMLVTRLLDYVNTMDAFRALANGRAGIVYNLMEDCKEALEPMGYSKESIESLRPIIDSAVYDKWGPDL